MCLVLDASPRGRVDLSVVLGRRTFNRIVEGAGRGPSYGPSPSTRAAHLGTLGAFNDHSAPWAKL